MQHDFIDDGKENYSKSSNEELKQLIKEDDEKFNSLFEGALKYDNPELKKLKQEIKDMIDQGKPDTEL